MVRSLDFRFTVIRSGADFCELHPANGAAPNIQANGSDSIQTSFSGVFLRPEAEINWLTDEIRPQIIIDGISYNLGVYLPASVQEADDGTSRTVSITANDRCWLARDYRANRSIYFPAGTNYVEAVVSLLAEAGIATISETASSETLAEDREDWDIGTSYLDIINGLLSEINYAPLWFDQDGVAVVAPIKTTTAVSIDHVLDETRIESLLLPGFQSVTNIQNAPNVFVCVCSNADKSAPMRAIAENTNPQSPLSIARRGRRITQVLQVNNIASQEALQAYANRQVTESMLSGEIITVQTCLLPGFGIGDVTAIRYGELLALCREKGWSMDLSVGGRMTHTLERSVINLDG